MFARLSIVALVASLAAAAPTVPMTYSTSGYTSAAKPYYPPPAFAPRPIFAPGPPPPMYAPAPPPPMYAPAPPVYAPAPIYAPAPAYGPVYAVGPARGFGALTGNTIGAIGSSVGSILDLVGLHGTAYGLASGSQAIGSVASIF